MKLKDFELQNGNHFIAMEYYGLILNRTFLILIIKDYLIGLKVNGIVSTEVKTGIGIDQKITSAITNSLAITEDLENPFSYVKNKNLIRLGDKDIYGEGILRDSYCNFKIKKSDIINVKYDKRKKWGMAYYPHDGKVYVKTKKSKKEFIILGNQSGDKIAQWIRK